MDTFEDIKALVAHYARGIWSNKWLSILIAWIVLVIGLVTVDSLQERFKAETKVYIDTTSVLRPLLKGIAVESDISSNIRLMVRKLLSRPNLERAIRIMDMDIKARSSADIEKIIGAVKSKVKISTVKRSNVYVLTYEDEDPIKAKKMVQIFLNIFVEDILGKSAKESDSAISFLDKQISNYETLLQEAEHRLETFKRKNVGVMPSDGANYFSQLQNISTQLEQASFELSEATNRRYRLISQLSELSEIEAPERNFVSRYDRRIATLEGELEDLLLIYTDAHPDVINANRILKSIYAKRKNELKEVGKNGQSTIGNNFSGNSTNPVYQGIQISLSETEANISSLRARVSNYRKKKSSLQKYVDIVPKIESDLATLNRDYEVHRNNYTELVSRREQARISEEVESGSEQIKFRVIEPPHAPKVAFFPNRPLFDAAVLVLALVVGYGVGLLLALTKPVFYNAKELRDYTGLAVLGSIIKFDTDEVMSRRKRNIFMFIITNLSLLFIALVVMSLHLKGITLLSS